MYQQWGEGKKSTVKIEAHEKYGKKERKRSSVIQVDNQLKT